MSFIYGAISGVLTFERKASSSTHLTTHLQLTSISSYKHF